MPFCIIAVPGAELRTGDLRRGMFLDNSVAANVIAGKRGLERISKASSASCGN